MNFEAFDDLSWKSVPTVKNFVSAQPTFGQQRTFRGGYGSDDIQVSAFLIEKWILNQEVLD